MSSPNSATQITLYFMLQPSIRYDEGTKAWLPVGISSLLIDRTPPPANGQPPGTLGTDSFSNLIGSMAAYLLQTYGNYNAAAPLTADNLSLLQTALGLNEGSPGVNKFDLNAVYAWLKASGLTFTIAVHPDTQMDAAIFPMVPGLNVTYNKQATVFGDDAPPPAYLDALNKYFAQLSFTSDGGVDSETAHAALRAAPALPPSPTWFPGVIFADYFDLLAKQLYQELNDLVTKKNVSGTLATDLGQIDIGNLAGIATRFLQHGLRVPDPAGDFNLPIEQLSMRALYTLTGQQFDVAAGETTAVIAVDSPKFTITIPDAGAANAILPLVLSAAPEQSPLWSPGALERIKQVPLNFMLRQGVAWAQALSTGNKTWQMFGFPDTLQSQLRQASTLNLQLSSTTGNGQPQPASGLEALTIRFALAQVPQTGATDKYLDNIFQVYGTDDATRDLLEVMFDRGDLSGAEVDLLLPAGGANGYTTSIADAQSTLMLKTNLSSYAQPDVSMLFAAAALDTAAPVVPPSLGPTFAPISNATDFLRLLWECSVVHSGGFYLYVPDLAQSSFGSQSRLSVALLVKSASAQSNSLVAVDAYHNTILVDTSAGLPQNSRIQAAVLAADGTTPVTVPRPNYPAGAIAFQAVWTSRDTPPVPSQVTADDPAAYAAALYQLLQFRLEAGGSIQGSGWGMPLGPNGDGNYWEYRRAVPLYRFVQPATENRYAAIGQSVEVDFELVDMFGNAFPLPESPVRMLAVYNDELVPLDQWPATAAVFAFKTGGGADPLLTLTITLQSGQIKAGQIDSVLAYYQLIYDQLTDVNTTLTVSSALAAGAISLQSATGDDTKTALGKFAAAVVAYLTAINSEGEVVAAVPPPPIILSGTVSISYVSQIEEDLFPVWVSVQTSRTAPAEPTPYVYPDGYLKVVAQVPPLLSADDANQTALDQWASDFETAFNKFDGGDALLKVLSGKPPTQITATGSMLGTSAAGAVTSTPGDLWAMKWSASAGVAVSFPNNAGQPQPTDKPVYLAPLPLSTELVTGDVEIFNYDPATGKQTTSATQTFSGIDLDGWARSFLQFFDGLLTPDLATAIARLDGNSYSSLMTAKEQLAYAISANISWVLQSQMPAGGNSGMGDLAAAQVRFREGLLASLATDFATSSIVQVPAAVSVKNTFETDDTSSQPPNFFGNPRPKTTDATAKQYTISTATLPIQNGSSYLTFLVGAVNPTVKADLLLAFNYDIAFIDHRFQTSEEKFGYLPSSWLRFVLPDADPANSGAPVLDVAMGTLDIPIPLRSYPAPPMLIGQSADAAYPNTDGIPPTAPPANISQALQWHYNLQLAPPRVAQDDLHLSILLNGAIVDRAVGPAQADALFDQLAKFQDFQTRYLPQALASILAANAPDPTIQKQWLSDIVSLVQGVATAWQAEGTQQWVGSDAAASAPPPAPASWDFILSIPDETTIPNITLHLKWKNSGGAPPLPTINGVLPPANPGNDNECTYTLKNPVDTLNLVWAGLSVITIQNISAAAWIERNETLLENEDTNLAFVYGTQTVSFHDPLVPLLQVPTKLTLKASSVSDAVSQLIYQIMGQPQPPAQLVPPDTQVGWGLEAGYSFVLVPGQGGELPLTTRLPVFLVKTALTTVASPPTGVETMAAFEAELLAALKQWYVNFHPSESNASLLFEVTLFASGSQQTLAKLLDIEVPIPPGNPGWWT